ncbi:hypothetical protein Tco_0005954, partial [Tanacetum coccineum]
MGLLDFVKSTNPFKVKVGERTLANNEVPLLEETKDMVISLFAQPISLVDHTIEDELKDNAGKKKRKVVFDAPIGLKGAESGSIPHLSEKFVSFYVTPTPEPDVPKDSGLTPDVNVQTRRVPERFVVTISSFERGDTDVFLRVKSPLPHVTAASLNVGFIDGAGASSIPRDNARTSTFVLDNPALCRNLIDYITSPRYWAALRNHTDVRFLDCFNANSAQHIGMVSELRLRYEHEIMSRERFQKKFTESSAVFQQKDAKIVALKAKLDTAEKEFNVELLGKVSTLESVHEELSNQDAAARHFEEQSAKLDARIADVRRDMDTDLYPHMLTAIAGRRWVLGCAIRLAVVIKCAQSFECHFALGKVPSLSINNGIQQGLEVEIEHGKAGRSLAQVEAYDPDVESKYVVAVNDMAAVNDFENVSFSLLKLEALKDSSLALSMSALTFEGDAHSTPKLCELQPSLDQVTIPVYSESSGLRGSSFIGHEMLFSAVGGVAGIVPVHGSSLGVADYQVSTLVHTGDTVPVA